MKRKLLKIWSLIMVMVISISTTGLAINKHYCGGHEKSKSIFFEAEKCTFEVSKSCTSGLDNQIDRKQCCNDKSSFLKQSLNVDIELNSYNFLDLDIISNVLIFKTENVLVKNSEKEIFNYRPPPLYRNIPILTQSFLL